MGDTANIVLGGVSSMTVDGVDVGFTTEGVKVNKEKEHIDVDLDQVIGVGKKYKSMEKLFVETTLAEPTLARLRIAFDEPAANLVLAGSQLDIGGNSSAVTEHTVVITGTGPGTSVTRTFTLYRAVSIDATDYIAGSRTEPSTVPIKLECLKDTAQGYKFGSIVDST